MNPKGLWAGVGVAVLLSLAALVLVNRKPVVLVQQSASGEPEIVAVGQSGLFGGTTGLDSLALKGDLSVDGNSTFTGTSAFTGAATFAGGITDSLGSFVGMSSSTMVSTSSTPCAVQNTSGRVRTIVDISVVYASTTSEGTFAITAGTSTTAFPTTTSTTPFINAAISVLNGKPVISTTSTVQTAYAPWLNSEWLVFRASTTTNVGTCRALFY